ncbi:hypothetical protein MMC28_000730 [Mycoblastus sanguinarius]|nr:hypothetical protein [Mycoblastus sanguinarius]
MPSTGHHTPGVYVQLDCKTYRQEPRFNRRHCEKTEESCLISQKRNTVAAVIDLDELKNFYRNIAQERKQPAAQDTPKIYFPRERPNESRQCALAESTFSVHPPLHGPPDLPILNVYPDADLVKSDPGVKAVFDYYSLIAGQLFKGYAEGSIAKLANHCELYKPKVEMLLEAAIKKEKELEQL